MFISDKLVFVELHKTGGTHILNLLEKISNGQRISKHNRVHKQYHDRYIIGSVRHPWDWYVSHWAYGCSGHGSVHSQLTRGLDLLYNYRQLAKKMGNNHLTAELWYRQILQGCEKIGCTLARHLSWHR